MNGRHQSACVKSREVHPGLMRDKKSHIHNIINNSIYYYPSIPTHILLKVSKKRMEQFMEASITISSQRGGSLQKMIHFYHVVSIDVYVGPPSVSESY